MAKEKRKEMLVFLIKQSGLTNQEIADKVNISLSSLEQYKSGTRNIPLDVAVKLSLLFVAKVDDIYSSSVREVNLEEIPIYQWESDIIQKVLELEELLH